MCIAGYFLNVRFKYKTSTFNLGEMYMNQVHSEHFQNVLKYNYEYISTTEQFFGTVRIKNNVEKKTW